MYSTVYSTCIMKIYSVHRTCIVLYSKIFNWLKIQNANKCILMKLILYRYITHFNEKLSPKYIWVRTPIVKPQIFSFNPRLWLRYYCFIIKPFNFLNVLPLQRYADFEIKNSGHNTENKTSWNNVIMTNSFQNISI